MSADRAAESQVDWRKLHRITPLLNAWKVAAALIAIFVWQYSDTLGQLDLPTTQFLLVIIGVIVVGSLIGLGYSALAWSRTRYGLSPESVYLHSGVLFRQQRHLRLDRVQTVDVTQPLLARLFGFASLKIESAGGAGSNLTLSFLTEDEAQRLRNELLARAAGVTVSESADGGQAPAAPAAPEREVLALTPGRLIGSLALSFWVMAFVVAGAVLIVLAVVNQSLAPIFGVGPALLGAVAYVWSRFAGEFAFRVATSPDGVRVRQGLLESKARTVPPGRVQAMQVSQPLLWRTRGWWRLQVNIAGYGAEETTGSVLYPVATTEEVGRLLYLVQPDLGAPRPLELLEAGLSGTGDAEGFVTSPRRVRWLDWWTWRRTGFRVTDTVTILRTGRIWRRMVIVPHERTQSLGLSEGPLDRRLRVANFSLHSTPGPIVPIVTHIDADVARELLVDVAERARRARREAGPERWMLPRAAAAAAAAASAGDAGAVPDPAAPPATYGGILPSPPVRAVYGGVLPGPGGAVANDPVDDGRMHG
ncbi:PH domain-containing protein [Occultella kanbiaonis]|uniref:PH domain-containing protein n=1 Tax=Occultella kanbiaonis TaxID=2675754 RepID=UPI0013CF50F3|nr:PH domain-containing protein [Occultella kanbiaonis]